MGLGTDPNGKPLWVNVLLDIDRLPVRHQYPRCHRMGISNYNDITRQSVFAGFLDTPADSR